MAEKHDSRQAAVSDIVGEMLMLSLVLILLAVFSASLGQFLPVDRDPSVTIRIDGSAENSTISLYHKGGDWVKRTDLTVIVYENMTSYRYAYSDTAFSMEPDSQSFDLGGRITINVSDDNIPVGSGSTEVKLVTPRAVIFSGMI